MTALADPTTDAPQAQGNISLEAVSDRVFASRLKPALQAALAGDGPVRIDARQVQTLTTPAIQLLIATARECQGQGRPFIVIQPSDAFVTAFDDLGLFFEIRDWSFEE